MSMYTLVQQMELLDWHNIEESDSGSVTAEHPDYPGMTVEVRDNEMYVLLEDEESGEAVEFTWKGLLNPAAASSSVMEFGVEVLP